MLNFKYNRLDYGKQLCPPPGYELSRAIATTYSLDLLSLLSIPVALFYAKNLDGKVNDNRMDILSAIDKTSDTVKVYCQKGKIKVPPEMHKLIAFVEECVVEVLPPNAATSFHSKVWVLRYSNAKKRVLYRVIVMSRNLTNDRSWDIGFFAEGFIGKRNLKENKPLVDFVSYLKGLEEFNESNQFIEDLAKVKFYINAPFDKMRFSPMGFENYKNPLQKEIFKDLLVVSPFIDKTSLYLISKQTTSKKCLFSRREELDKIPASDLTNWETYAFSQKIVEGETYEGIDEDASEIPGLQQLHAKLYIGSLKDNSTRWYLGSANFSWPALNHNGEFLVGLDTNDRSASFSQMYNLLTGVNENIVLFEPYEPRESVIENKEHDFRSIRYDLLKYLEEVGNFWGECIKEDPISFNYTILIHHKIHELFNNTDYSISVAPIGWQGNSKYPLINSTLHFEEISLQRLSPFLVWKITYLETGETEEFMSMMKIVLPDNRKSSIFQSIINNKEKFYQFIIFLLGNNTDSIEFNAGTIIADERGRAVGSSLFNVETPLFEEMLLASSRNPAKIKEIESMVNRLYGADKGAVPPEFVAFLKTFLEVGINE